MKKILTIILATVLCLSMTACTQKSESVKNTEVMIKAIGTVTDQSGSDLLVAEKFYNKLSSEEKGQVSNYDTLVQARETYNTLILYGQWTQYGVADSLSFTLAEDGTFAISDGRTGQYDVTDSQIILHTEQEDIAFTKEMDRNLLHLKTEYGDYIRPDLLTVDRHKIVSSSWYRFFDVYYHLHIVKDEMGIENGYWNCYQLMPKEEYRDVIAPETEVTMTMTYTTRDIATTYNPGDDSLVIVEELTDPVEQSVTVTLSAEAFTYDGCCSEEYDVVRGDTSQYGDYNYVIRTLEYLENPDVTEFSGYLYYYDQLFEE